jgi:hypothetical protein
MKVDTICDYTGAMDIDKLSQTNQMVWPPNNSARRLCLKMKFKHHISHMKNRRPRVFPLLTLYLILTIEMNAYSP